MNIHVMVSCRMCQHPIHLNPPVDGHADGSISPTSRGAYLMTMGWRVHAKAMHGVG